MRFGKQLITNTLLGLSLLVGLSAASAAPTVTYGALSGTQCATTNDNSQTAVEPLVESASCANGNVNLLYKADVGDQESPATTETGSFAGSYSTVFFNTALDPEDATISYSGGLAIDCTLGCFLSVKDGNATPATYVFNISNWDGTSDIVMQNFWENARGAISNVAIWGQGGGKVPEPGTLGLLGLGILGLVALRRRRTQ